MPENQPNKFTTVTPFSKALAMILFITLPIVTLFIGMQIGNQNNPDTKMPIILQPTEVVTPSVTPTFEEKVVSKITLEECANKPTLDGIPYGCYEVKDSINGESFAAFNLSNPYSSVKIGLRDGIVQYIVEEGSEGGDVWLYPYSFNLDTKKLTKLESHITSTQGRYFHSCRKQNEICQDLSKGEAYADGCFDELPAWRDDTGIGVDEKEDTIKINTAFYAARKKYAGSASQIDLYGIDCY